MNHGLRYANTATPIPGSIWRNHSDPERLELVKQTLQVNMPSLLEILKIIAARPDGQVIVKFQQPLSAAKRGTLLLDIETLLKTSLDPALVIWHEALNDRSSLRNLRGIEVKA